MSISEPKGVAVVTGASRGIGREIAISLATAGYLVAALGRSESDLLETISVTEKVGPRAVPFLVEVTNEEEVVRTISEIEKTIGAVDLLVNNAGVIGPTGLIWDKSFDSVDWWECLNVNIRGPFLFSRAVLSGMVERGQGRIINLTSAAALDARPWMAVYGLSKTAITRFSEVLAMEVEPHGITIFSLDPGLVRTAMPESLVESGADEKWLGGAFAKRFREGAVPPQRAAELTVTLASGKADALSGLHLSIRDNIEELVKRAEEISDKGLYRLRLDRLT
jgi:3-oxoacyl-[acyl-carrier protein] reductase